MQFDKFDKKAREAADHHHPAYDEQAWGKMEQLLNKHLPREEDNRRRFLLLLFLFLGLGAAGLLIAKPWGAKKSGAITKQVQPVPVKKVVPVGTGTETGLTTTNSDPITAKNEDRVNDNTSVSINDQSSPVTAPGNKQVTQAIPTDQSKKNKASSLSVFNSSLPEKENKPVPVNQDKENITTANILKDKKDKPVNATTTAAALAATTQPVKDEAATTKKPSETIVTTTPVIATTQPSGIDPVLNNTKKEDKTMIQDKAKKEKSKSKKSNSFFFTLSAGPDISFVGNDKLGTMKLLGGAGIGYTFNDRVTLRTGFYSGRKVYTASPGACHPPAEFYTYYPYLEKVEVDCKVYEIPLNISYNFSHAGKHHFFATTGLSSYLMKRETYDYYYKYNPSGTVYNRQITFNNENKHLFSVLSLSGGYQRNFGKHVSVMMEPYVKLPLSGAGYGKVRLNSAGVLLSVGFKPFAGKKEKPLMSQ